MPVAHFFGEWLFSGSGFFPCSPPEPVVTRSRLVDCGPILQRFGLCHQSCSSFSSRSRGSSIAKIIGRNVKASNRFDPMVNMWVYEEMIDGRKLTEIINTEHQNVKYLPGHTLPANVVR